MQHDDIFADLTSLLYWCSDEEGHTTDHGVAKTVVSCKIKHFQKCCKNVLVFYFTCDHL